MQKTVTTLLVILATVLSITNCGEAAKSIKADVTIGHGPQRPSSIPIVPPLKAGRTLFFGPIPDPPGEGDYQPIDGGYFKHNGDGKFNHLISSGAWLLKAGDKPQISMTLRPGRSAYASPALLPGLGVNGQLQVLVTAGSKSKQLDMFDSIDTSLYPGSAHWRCSDEELGVTIELSANPFIDPYGFAAEAKLVSGGEKEVKLVWVFGRDRNKAGASSTADTVSDEIELKDTYALLSDADIEYSRICVGTESGKNAVKLGPHQGVVIETQLAKDARGRFICVWGYKDYDKEAVEGAYNRLEFRPFADPQWVEQMKKKWFHHWVGKGLEPEKKFLAVRSDCGKFLAESKSFWNRQRRRVRVKTPDSRFDNVVNCTAALLPTQYEYPSFIHGQSYAKYGKINCGYYGANAAGYHAEVDSSLKFISGTQCVKGRQRYFTPAFAVSAWAEEVNFYFVEQVWYHYRWTGDLEFLKVMWPSVRRALEHGLSASDPDGDGLMTGFYEMWNGDTYARGGKSALQTAMAWSALKCAAQTAAILDDVDHAPGSKGLRSIYIRDFNKRYEMFMERCETQFNKHLWNKEVGAWCSAEWNGDMRPRPASHEQNYHIWRGLGSPMRNYMAMRYIRDNLQLTTKSGVIAEFNDFWWPILWSHHYVANGDTCSSVASACAAGDIDNFWDAMKSISESAYASKNALIWQATGSHAQEIEPPFVHAVIDGMFGVQPYFGENLLLLRPGLPSHWDQAQISLADASYKYSKDADSVSLRVITPVKRKVRAELPVKSQVKSVTVNGKAAKYELEPAVNCCRVVIDSEAATEHNFEIEVAAAKPSVSGDTLAIIGEEAEFVVSNATLRMLHNPQKKIQDTSVTTYLNGQSEASVTPHQTGKYTIFLELESGNVNWLYPLDLDVRERWTIVKEYVPGLTKARCAVKSPAIDTETKTLTLKIQNNRRNSFSQQAVITVADKNFRKIVNLPANGTDTVTVSLEEVWEKLSPGSIPIKVRLAGRTEASDAVNWDIGKDKPADFTGKLRPIDLKPNYNIPLRKLYGPDFEWRIDYTGSAIGVDWRDPMPLKDEKGYFLTAPPMTQFVYHLLWEARSHHGPFKGQWETPKLKHPFETPVGVTFSTAGAQAENDLLALASNEPYEQLPSSAQITLEKPLRLEKIYLLTANLTKILKCYYPGAEVIVNYEKGQRQTVQLIPPYTMSCLVQDVSPRAYAIEFGKFAKLRGPLMDREKPNIAVSDIVLDPTRKVRSIELRCVTSETIFGILGMTVLEAR